MPLNEREQKILEEIERQFYQEDPKLAQTVATTTLESVQRNVIGNIGVGEFESFSSEHMATTGGSVDLLMIDAFEASETYQTVYFEGGEKGGKTMRFEIDWRKDRGSMP